MIAAIAAPLGLTALPGVALAQSAPAADTAAQEVVVTGSIIRRKNVESNSPLTVITAADLDQRGITTIQSAVQNLSGNNSGALPNNFTGNGAFAAGASGASLRGLTTNSTLVLVDGLRAAYYPLADDGARNFVDLNTIPDVIIDRVEVLQDGASSTYGADAIAGVINIITKKTYQGFMAKVEGGFAEHGGAGERNIQALFGHGDLGADGYNVYIGAEYEKDDILYSRQRGFPYNTNDFSSLCAPSVSPATAPTNTVNSAGVTCRTNGIVNGIQAPTVAYPAGQFLGIGTDIVAATAPYDATNTTRLGNFQMLNPALCTGGSLKPVTITAANSASGAYIGSNLCQQDFRHDYNIISPEDERFSISGHFIKNIGSSAQFYVEANYYQNDVFSTSAPSAIRVSTPPAALGLTTSTATIALPVYVCPTGSATHICAATDPGAKLNPNNPYAAANDVARIYYSFGDIHRSNEELSHTFRLAGGLNGTFGKDWRYDIEGTVMQTDLDVTFKGVPFINNLLTAVNQGSYNFITPSTNTDAIRQYIAPTRVQNTNSQLGMLQANVSKPLFDLPGGPVVLGVSGAIRYESLYDPSANDDANGIYQRYTTAINPFGAIGQRNVYSAAFEVDAPVVKQLDVNISGRYDNYSSGQDNFSPKFGAKFKPVQWLTLRGTYSKGFRIPAFAEANSLPTTGYVTQSAPLSFQAAHGNDGYGQGYSLGLTTLGNPNLQPEKSTNITGGVVFEPTRNLTFTVDYYNIKKTGVIAGPNTSPAVAAYFAGTAIPAGFTIIPGPVDPLFPNAKALPQFVLYGVANLNSLETDGFDFTASARYNLPSWTWNAHWTSTFTGTYVTKYDLNDGSGTIQHYAGTLGPCNTTSCSGTPRLRWNWQNTLDWGKLTLSATVYYSGGYKNTAADYGGDGTCLGGVGVGAPAGYRDNLTPITCQTKAFVDTELHGAYQLTKRLQLYFDIDNLFDEKPPYDATTYGGSNYNPAWASSGILGRYFKIGAKATF